MKPMVEIARAELKRLFFSPVSWLILIVFAFQVMAVFNGAITYLLYMKEQNMVPSNLTFQFFSGHISYFINTQGFFYLYFPLLTMNIMSRDLSSGTIKLLYSSPLSNCQIILGKYLSLVLFSALMVLIIVLPALYATIYIEHTDWPLVLSGATGLWLLTCAFAAVGLFVSSLTSYAIVAAFVTFGILAFCQHISSYGQETPVIRDITYWFTIGGRSESFIKGLISTEAISYFVAFIGFFISLALVNMRSNRMKKSAVNTFGNYLLIVLAVSLIGFYSSKPMLKKYWDLSHNKINTLSEKSQQVINKVKGDLVIRTYANLLNFQTNSISAPRNYKEDVARFDEYTRFKPEIDFEHIYYYKYVPDDRLDKRFKGLSDDQILDTFRKGGRWDFDMVPWSKIRHQADLASEGFRYVNQLESANGKHTLLRVFENNGMSFPGEQHITAAFKRLTDTMPVVAFVTDKSARLMNGMNEKGYFNFTSNRLLPVSLYNHGFDLQEVSLQKSIPRAIDILVIMDIKTPFNEGELTNFREFLNRGGNCLIAAEPDKLEVMKPLLEPLGVEMVKGMLMQPKKKIVPEVVQSRVTKAGEKYNWMLGGLHNAPVVVNMPGVSGLTYRQQEFTVTELLTTDTTTVWNELTTTNIEEDSVTLDTEAGEQQQTYVTALGLHRTVNGKSQHIIVTGDADWMSNGEMSRIRAGRVGCNFNLFQATFSILSDNVLPIDVRRAPAADTKFLLNKKAFPPVALFLKWGVASMLLLCGIVLLVRRKGR